MPRCSAGELRCRPSHQAERVLGLVDGNVFPFGTKLLTSDGEHDPAPGAPSHQHLDKSQLRNINKKFCRKYMPANIAYAIVLQRDMHNGTNRPSFLHKPQQDFNCLRSINKNRIVVEPLYLNNLANQRQDTKIGKWGSLLYAIDLVLRQKSGRIMQTVIR